MGRELICPGAALLAPEARRAQAIPTGTVEGNTELGLLPRNKETTKTLVIHLKASRTLESGPYPRNGHPAPPSPLPPLTPHPNGQQLMLSLSPSQFSSVAHLCPTPWTAAHQASLSITNSRSLLKLMSIKSVMPSNPLILCRPLLLLPSIFPTIRVFANESVLAFGGQSIGISASVLPMSIQD